MITMNAVTKDLEYLDEVCKFLEGQTEQLINSLDSETSSAILYIKDSLPTLVATYKAVSRLVDLMHRGNVHMYTLTRFVQTHCLEYRCNEVWLAAEDPLFFEAVDQLVRKVDERERVERLLKAGAEVTKHD